MTQVEDFEKLISAKPDLSAPLINIYSPLISSRLHYVCHFVFNRVLRVHVHIETDLVKFANRKGAGINYSDHSVPAELQIIPAGFVFETGISEQKPEAIIEEGKICFFKTKSSASSFSFDIFSAVFYFISRYEEYQAFEKDAHGRFEAKESLLFKTKFHLKPVVDQWIMDLETALGLSYPALQFPSRSFRVISTLDVDNFFAFRYKGLARTLGASLKDLLKRDLKNLKLRWNVLSGKLPDPFDVYEDVSAFCQKQGIPLYWFFLFKTGTTYDRTVNPKSPAYHQTFKQLKDHKAHIGLHPSYHSAYSSGMLNEELTAFRAKLKEEVVISRQHYLRFDIKTSPALLLKNGIRADFSMGFASSIGFRAGTSHPFPYYNFEKEQAEDLVFVPFCAMDGAYFVYDTIPPEEALKSLLSIASEVKKTRGIFISVFHERSFANHLYPGFGTLYKNLHLQLKQL